MDGELLWTRGLHVGKDIDFFNAFHEPNDRLDELVTGRALSPGQNPLLKPPSAWLGTEPTDGDTKTIKSAKLVLRTLRSKIDIPPDSVRCPFPPTKFEKLWIAVKLLKGPVKNQQVDAYCWLRSHPDLLPQVLGPDMDRVLRACRLMVKDARKAFDEAGDRRNRTETNTFMTQIDDLLCSRPVTELPSPQKSPLWLPRGGPQDHHSLRHQVAHALTWRSSLSTSPWTAGVWRCSTPPRRPSSLAQRRPSSPWHIARKACSWGSSGFARWTLEASCV